MKKLNSCCALKINSFELFQVSEETQDKDNPLGASPCRLKEQPVPSELCVLPPSFPQHPACSELFGVRPFCCSWHLLCLCILTLSAPLESSAWALPFPRCPSGPHTPSPQPCTALCSPRAIPQLLGLPTSPRPAGPVPSALLRALCLRSQRCCLPRGLFLLHCRGLFQFLNHLF